MRKRYFLRIQLLSIMEMTCALAYMDRRKNKSVRVTDEGIERYVIRVSLPVPSCVYVNTLVCIMPGFET